MSRVKIWTECKGEYLPLGKGKIVDIYEGMNGEDRHDFICEHCKCEHTNAQAIRQR